MTNLEKWNSIVIERDQKLLNKQENKVQSAWESYCSELFGYLRICGEIDAQRSVHIGSHEREIPDIILRRDGKDIFDIELKQYSFSFDSSFEQQLISYLERLHLSVGMIVCSAIYLYYYDYAQSKAERLVIPFKMNSELGEQLVSLLQKDSFEADAIRDFIREKKQCEEKKNAVAKPVTQPSVSGGFDIWEAMERWAAVKAETGELYYRRDDSYLPDYGEDHRWLRFTTKGMDSVITPQKDAISGWGVPQFYFYEIEYKNKSGKISVGMKLSFNHENVPMQTREEQNSVYAYKVTTPWNERWGWPGIKAQGRTVSDISGEAELYAVLDKQFEKLISQENELLSYLGKK